MTSLTDEIQEKAQALGFALVGVAPAESMPETEERMRERVRAGHLADMAWFNEERVHQLGDPRRVFPFARSILALATSYLQSEEAPPAPRFRGESDNEGGLTGRVARYAWGRDYHDVIKGRLKELIGWLRQRLDAPVEAAGMVDTGRCAERAVAVRAGLGFWGKNTNLLTRTYGSWVLLSEIMVGQELEPGSPLLDSCGSCTLCLQACPTGALTDPYVLDSRRCISYLTIELRDGMPPELRPRVGQEVFGCDICQDVCPRNRRARPAAWPELAPAQGAGSRLPLPMLFGLGEAEFRARFRGTPLLRPKRRGLLRNAAVVLGNRGDRAAVPALSRGLADPEPLVRGHSAWALGRLGGPQARAALERARARETDPSARREIEGALAGG